MRCNEVHGLLISFFSFSDSCNTTIGCMHEEAGVCIMDT